MWEVGLLAFLIALGFGVAIVMARKTKAPNKVTIVQNHEAQNIDLEELATKVARAVAKEVAEEVLKKLPKGQIYHGDSSDDFGVDMDIDKIIPIAVDAAVAGTSLEGAVKEEKAIDKDLKKSKSKLAEVLKRKKAKDDGQT